MEKFHKIKNRGFNLNKYTNRGFIVQEKLDGSNGSFTFNDGKLEIFSRRTKLDPENNLNGFYQYVHNFYDSLLNIERKEFKMLLDNHIFFGEWLVPHKVYYAEYYSKDFYLFDIWEKNTKRYLSYDEVKDFAEKFGFRTPEVFLHVQPKDVPTFNEEDVVKLAGKSNISSPKDTGEGIVIKYLDGKDEHEDYYKIVTDKFRELMNQKTTNKVNKNTSSVADYAITKARFEKIIFRAMDEGRLTEDDLVFEQFGKIMKECVNDFVDDIIDEELDQMVELIKKQIKKKSPHVLRTILEEKIN